ncbi:MAG TPA: hypothetical protein VGH87_08510 [Polyangiaceae bacterium]|jgi:hypothetical protein|nr:hypothetical protein [Polyangiaceae bacterium]
MKLCLIGFGLLVACGGAESSLFDPAAATATDPVTAEASAPITLPDADASASPDANDDDVATTCADYADPSTEGDCHACSGSSCQTNGCFGGWYCKLDTQKCVAKPDGC